MRLLLLALGAVFLGLIIFVAGYLAMYPFLYPTYSHRYRLTLEVETPEGLKTASGVIETSVVKQPRILTTRSTHTDLKGDAVFLDLGNGKNVTALLALGPSGQNVDGPVTLAVKAFDCTACQDRLVEWRNLSHRSGTRDLSRDLMPTLVTFSDVKDPTTAHVVAPGEFEAVFGPGYRFKRVWVEMTTDPVTTGLRAIIPWIDNYEAEKAFEQRLRETGGPGAGSRMPGMNLSRR